MDEGNRKREEWKHEGKKKKGVKKEEKTATWCYIMSLFERPVNKQQKPVITTKLETCCP